MSSVSESHIIAIERGGQQQIHKVFLSAESPIVIGRGWQCDVVVDDEYVDARHVELSVDDAGEVFVSDLQTRNGTRLGKQRLSAITSCTPGARIAIGESTLTLHARETTVAPALKRDAVHAAAHQFTSFGWVIAATLIGITGLLASAWWGNSVEVTSESLFEMLTGALIFGIGWTIAAGIVGKLFRHKMYLTLHWGFICITVAVTSLVVLLTDLLRFNTESLLIADLVQIGSTGLMVALAAYCAISLCTRLGSRRKLAAAIVVALLPIAFDMVGPMLAEEHEQWSDMASDDTVIQPPELYLGKPVTLDTHLERTATLFDVLDAELDSGDPLPSSLEAPGKPAPVRLSGLD